MAKFMQLAVGFGAACFVGELVHGTPLYHYGVIVPVFVGAMYATALLQARLHWRRSSWGSADKPPGARAKGAPPRA